jgi:positive regulator of sigma E activity
MGLMTSRPGSRTLADMAHGFTTLPAMLVIIVAVVGGVLGALVAGMLGASEWIAIAMGAVVAVVTIAVASFLSQRAFFRFIRTLETRFPSNA